MVGPDRSDPRTRRRIGFWFGVVVYGSFSAIAYLHVFPANGHLLFSGAGGDVAQETWFLQWTSYAVLHGHNPLVTTFVDYPRGANLAQNTTMPLLGILAAPISWIAGPVGAANFLFWLAPTASASACYFVLRRCVTRPLAAFVGGLFYGFSPYMVGQAIGHLNLLFVPLPPLIFWVLYELLVRRAANPRRWGAALGLLAAAQFLISPEILLDTALVAAIGLALLALARPRRAGSTARTAWGGLVVASLVGALLVAYPAFLFVVGPNRYHGSAHGAYPFPDDLLSLVVPDRNQALTPGSIASVGNHFIMGNVVENGGYVGIPLLVVLIVITVRWWRSPLVRLSAAGAVITWVLSLGPRLTVDTHITWFPLPFALLEHLPLFPSLVDARLALFTDLFVAVLLAIGIDGVLAGLPSWRPRPDRSRVPLAVVTGAVVTVALLIVASLVPPWPMPAFAVSAPAFFHSTAVHRIPPGGVVLAYPYPAGGNDDAMLWQAGEGMGFRLIGGTLLVPDATGAASFDPFPLGAEAVPAALVASYLGVSPAAVSPGVPATPPSTSEVRAFLVKFGVSTVIFHSAGVDPAAAHLLFVDALGPPDVTTGGVDAWFDVPANERLHLPT
jgi:hypothetical protein